MITVDSSVSLNTPAKAVFDYLCDPNNQVDWTPNFIEMLEGPSGAPGLGMHYKGRLKAFGSVNFVVDRWEPGRMFRVDTDPKVGRLTHQFTVVSVGGGSQVDHVVEFEPKGVLRLVSPVMNLLIKKMIADLDQQMSRVLNAI
jgi:hypothetical protein